MKIDNVAVISLEDYAEYQELKRQKSTADFIIAGISHDLKLKSRAFYTVSPQSIDGTVTIDLNSSGDLSHLLDDKNNVCLGKLINHLREKTFKGDFLGKFIQS